MLPNEQFRRPWVTILARQAPHRCTTDNFCPTSSSERSRGFRHRRRLLGSSQLRPDQHQRLACCAFVAAYAAPVQARSR
jgi:hypothetical protein